MTAVTNLALIPVPSHANQLRGRVGRAQRVNTETATTPVWKKQAELQEFCPDWQQIGSFLPLLC